MFSYGIWKEIEIIFKNFIFKTGVSFITAMAMAIKGVWGSCGILGLYDNFIKFKTLILHIFTGILILRL